MRRRNLLGFIGVSSVGLSGCLTGRNTDRQEPETDTTNDESEGEQCRDDVYGYLFVDLVPTVPDNATVKGIDQLPENEYIERALSRASDEYEPGMEDELNESEKERLVTLDGGTKLSSQEPFGGHPSAYDFGYVEYDDVTYNLHYDYSQEC